MRITAADLKQLGVIERIVEEPLGGAHRRPEEAIASLGAALTQELDALATRSGDELRAERRAKFVAIG
jgi:acetyl-CoA carboxylase carboxyl transferase subunit alpha